LAHLADPKFIDAVRCGPFTFRSTDVGVVMDLMIHDIDLVLSLARSPVRRVEAMGVSVLGGHEDAANARIEFESGCVAQLSASRVSYESARRMQAWTPQSFVAIDFGARDASLVCPSPALREGRFDVDGLSPEQVEHYKTHLADEHLPRKQVACEAVDALALEAADFVEAIRLERPPRVTGQAGRDAVAVAERILQRVNHHAWDGTPDGRMGPHLQPGRAIVPAPHFNVTGQPTIHKAAG
jgi:predicted dehydrogenase